MRFVIYGAGAIGGTIGARLFQHGHDVVLIARGAHREAIADHGLHLVSPDDEATLPVPVVGHPREIEWHADDVVVLSMKSQDTVAAVKALAASAPPSIAVVCAQNGVQNELMTLRRFARVYAMCVMCPASQLIPGEVLVHCAPVSAIVDLGRYPPAEDTDETARAIAAALSSSTFLSEARADIMAWKYRKLLLNLGNAVQALCGPEADGEPIARLARKEGHRVYDAAGIVAVSADKDAERRADHLAIRPVDGRPYRGWSTWQSLERAAASGTTGSVEVDYLNGEIVLQGRLIGVPTPVNETLQDLVNGLARSGAKPGSMTVDEVLTRVPRTN